MSDKKFHWRRWLRVSLVVGLLSVVCISLTCLGIYWHRMKVVTKHAINSPCEESPRSQQPHRKIVHQIFYTSQEIPVVPHTWKAAILSCKNKNPGYEFILWTEEKVEKLLAKEYPWFLETYHNYSYLIQRIDVARLFILYTYGGVYMDLDEVCLESWDVILGNRTGCDVILVETTPWGVSNGLFLARPRDPFLWHIITNLAGSEHKWFILKHFTVMLSTGPTMVSDRMATYPGRKFIKVLSLEERAQSFENLRAGTWHGGDEIIIDLVTAPYKLILLLVALSLFVFGACRRGTRDCFA